jgi:hypothetical protein
VLSAGATALETEPAPAAEQREPEPLPPAPPLSPLPLPLPQVSFQPVISVASRDCGTPLGLPHVRVHQWAATPRSHVPDSRSREPFEARPSGEAAAAAKPPLLFAAGLAVISLLRLHRSRAASRAAPPPVLAPLSPPLPDRAAPPAEAADEREADEPRAMLAAPVVRGSELELLSEERQWRYVVGLLRADGKLTLTRPLRVPGGCAEVVPIAGAQCSLVRGQPRVFSLTCVEGRRRLLRAATRREAAAWARALTTAAAAGGGLASALRPVHAADPFPQLPSLSGSDGSDGASSSFVGSSEVEEEEEEEEEEDEDEDDDEDEEDALGELSPQGIPRRAHFGVTPVLRSPMRRRRRLDSLRAEVALSSPPPPLVVGTLVVTRSLVAVGMAPLRLAAALAILPFALLASGAGAARQALGGGGRRMPLPPPSLSEAERRSDASNPERRALMDRFLGDAESSVAS